MSFRKIAEDRAGHLVARWRTRWGDWVEHWSRYNPGKAGPNVPGLLTRLKLAREIADEIEAALEDHEAALDQALKPRKKRK